MVNLDSLLFGYRCGSVAKEDTAKLINLLLKAGIGTRTSPDGSFVIKERDVKKFKAAAAGRLRYSIGELCGIPGVLKQFLARKGIVAALVTVLMLHVFLSFVVWDIRVEGNERLSEDEVVEALRDNGFEVGDLWRGFDKNLVETSVLLNCPDISWISVNRRGTVAYVRVEESENLGKKDENAPRYSNIIADRDAVIEDVIVESGVAMVKKGDVVKKGDLLISGIIESPSGTGFCRAKGSVIGQSVTELSVEIPKKGTEKEYFDESVYEIRIKIFKISINIFKNYRICLNEYDIIEDEREYTFLGRCRLPFSLTVVKRREYARRDVTYSELEMAEMAKAQMNDNVEEAMRGCTVTKLKSSGGLREGSYFLSTKIVYLANIAGEREFEVRS